MGTFQITGPNGKKYRVTGDDPAGAVLALKKMLGADTAAAVNPATNQPGDVPAYVPPGVEGYDPQTGEVQKYSGPNSAGMGAADMTTFGFGDELASYLGSALSDVRHAPSEAGFQGVPSDQILQEIRGNQTQAQQDNPKSYMAGQVAGGIAQGVAAGPGILASAPSTIARVGGGMLTGAGMGGLYGLGSGEGVGGRLYEGGKDAAIGALTGGAFPLAAKGVSSAYSAIVNALKGNAAAKVAGTTPDVLRMVGNILDADGTRGPVGAANMARAGSDQMLVDAGPNARAVLDTAIQRGGPGAVAARDAVTARTDRAGAAITDALDANLGAPAGVTASKTAIRQGSAGARSADYKAAYAAPIDYADPRGQAIEQIVKSRVPKSAIDAANELMRTEGAQSKQILAKVADDGSVTFERLPDVQQLDYITRGLNEVADKAHGEGKLGGTTARGRAYENLSSEIRGHLKDLVPEYGQALETSGDAIRRSKAIDLGSKLLSTATTRDQAAEAAQGMTQAEKDTVLQGVRSNLDDAMANVTRTVQDGDTPAREAIKALKDLSSRANREKLETFAGKAKADALFDEFDRAATSFDLRASVADNTKTFARLATDRRVRDMTAPGVVAEGVAGVAKPIKSIQRIAEALAGQSPAHVSQKQDAIYSQIAEILTRSGAQAQPIFDAIQGLGKSDAATKLMSDRIVRALAGPHLAYPTTNLAQDKLRSLSGRR